MQPLWLKFVSSDSHSTGSLQVNPAAALETMSRSVRFVSSRMSAFTEAGLFWPTLGLRTSTTLNACSGSAMRAQPLKMTLSSSFSSLLSAQLQTLAAHGKLSLSQRCACYVITRHEPPVMHHLPLWIC